MEPPESNGLTVAQAAEALGLAVSTVYLQIARGRIAAVQVEGHHRISPTEITRYHRDHLGHSGWRLRRSPDYVPSQGAVTTRRSRVRRRAIDTLLSLDFA